MGRRSPLWFQKSRAAIWQLSRIQSGSCLAASSQEHPWPHHRILQASASSTATHLPVHPFSLLLGHPLTQGVRLPILVWDSEHAYNLMAFLPQVAVNFLAEQALPNHCDLHGSQGGSGGPEKEQGCSMGQGLLAQAMQVQSTLPACPCPNLSDPSGGPQWQTTTERLPRERTRRKGSVRGILDARKL